MAAENFTTYTEVDPNSHITVTSAARIDFAGLAKNEDAWCSSDKGVGHFASDFEHLAEIQMTSSAGTDGTAGFITLSNILDDIQGIKTASGDALYCRWEEGGATLYVWEDIAGTSYFSSYVGSYATPYYIKFKRDEAVGTYGTLYLYIYSDSARTNLLATRSIALHEKEDFRYLFAGHSRNMALSGHTTTGYIKDLDLQETGAGVVIPVFMAQYRQRWA